MNVTLDLEKLRAKAAERPPGYLEDFLAAGSTENGKLLMSYSEFRRLHSKYAPSPIPHSALHTPRLKGLGDTIALIATPIARAIDRIAGTNLENCKPCASRRAKLNAAVPFKSL